MNHAQDLLHKAQLAAAPGRTLVEREENDARADMQSVADVLAEYYPDYHPIKSMLDGKQNMKSVGLKFAVDRYIGNKLYADQKAIVQTIAGSLEIKTIERRIIDTAN